MRHVLRLSLALAASALLLCACDRPSKFPDKPVGTRETDPLYMVPPGVDAIILLNPAAVSKSVWGEKLMNSRALTGGSETKELEDCLGSKLMSQTAPIAIGFWLPSQMNIGVMPQVVFIQATSYTAEQLAECSKTATQVDLGGHPAWRIEPEATDRTPPPEQGGPTATYMAQHGPFVIVGNDETRMKQTLSNAAKGGDGYIRSPKAREALRYVDQTAAISGIITNPAPFGVPMYMAAGYLEITDSVRIQVVVELKSPQEASQNAKELSDALRDTRQKYAAMMPPALVTLVDGVSIGSSSNLLTLGLKADRGTVEQVVALVTGQLEAAREAAQLQQAVGQRARGFDQGPPFGAAPAKGANQPANEAANEAADDEAEDGGDADDGSD